MSSINLLTHQAELKDAWEEVLDENRATNWALFGYDGQTYNLKLVGKGDGGLEELKDEFLASAIMYAFCRVTIPPSGVKRNVLINWQGEGAPVVRKGCCANHLGEVGRFFRGYQLIIHARYDDEVEPATIIDQLVKCCAAAGIQRASEVTDDTSGGPVGSVYQKVQPQKDVVSMSEREKFWQKQQEDEKRREKEEKKAIEEKRKREADELRRRELEASKAREAKYVQEVKAKTGTESTPPKRSVVPSVKKLDTSMWEKQIKEAEKEGKPAVPLPPKIVEKKQSVNDARAIFEGRKKPENSLPDVVPVKSAQSVGVTPGKITIPKFEEKPVEKTKVEIEKPKPPSEEFSYTKNLLVEQRRDSVEDSNGHNEEEQDWEEEPLEEPPTKIPDPLVDAMLEQGIISPAPPVTTNTITANPEPQATFVDPLSDQGQCARALYDYKAADDTEISFDPDDIITNIDQIDEGWWQGVGPDGTFGLFPANYVALI